ncbi:MAG TPA: PAS domain-containing protein [Chitinophagaceae bacterium]|nr:PAS domain-containing protein [Chitinophagaceae bacterium]
MKSPQDLSLEESLAGYWDWRMADNTAWVSPSFKRMLGYDDDLLPNNPDIFTRFLLPADKVIFSAKLDAHIKSHGEVPFAVKLRYLHKNSSTITIFSTGKVIEWAGDGSPVLMSGCNVNLTRQEEAEKELLKAQDMLLKTNQATLVGGWEIDLVTGKTTWTEVTKQIHEVAADFEPSIKAGLTFYKAEHHDKIKTAFDELIEKGISYDIEVEMVTAKERHVWVRVFGYPVFENGKCVRAYGTMQDITEHKNAKERLAVIFEESTDAHLLFNDTGIIDCNNAAVKMIGCSSKSELQRYHPADFSPEYQPDGKRSTEKSLEMDAIARKNGIHTFEWIHKKLNGEEFPVEVTLNTVKISGKPAMLVVWHDITERKRAEERLKQNEALLNETQQLTHSGSWESDLVTGTNTWSAEAFRIFGLTPEGAGPQTDVFGNMIHPLDRGIYKEAIKNAINHKISADFELRIIRADGTVRWIRAIGKPFENKQGVVVKLHGAISDITEQKEAREAIRLKQEQLTRFIAFAPVAIAMLDKNMHYIAASNVWKEDYKLTNVDITGKNHYDIFPAVLKDRKQLHERALKGEILRKDEEFIVFADGRQEWIKWEMHPWYEKENEVGGLIMFTEMITSQKEASEALKKAKEQAEQAAIAKSQFLTTMSHEIRTPMNAVIGFTHLLMRNAREDQKEFLRILKFSGENLLVLINDILDFSKIEAGKIEIEDVDFNLKEQVNTIKAALSHKAKSKGLQLKLLIDNDIPDFVVGDPVRLGQIITNLATNAVKFTEEGSVIISALLTKQTKQNISIYFEVKDTGIGIPEDKQGAIFESFTQASSDTTRKFGGTGLGLTITKRLLELMGSKIQLKSKPGEGSVFSFELTFKTSDKKTEVIEEAITDDGKKSIKDIKILIVDDSRVNVLLAQELLKQWKGSADVALNGRIALDMIKQKDYDVVLMDLQMPEMDGYQATMEVRKLPGDKYRQLPIIALTASAMLEIKDKAFTVGMNDYISKPFNPDELYRKIIKYTANRVHGTVTA